MLTGHQDMCMPWKEMVAGKVTTTTMRNKNAGVKCRKCGKTGHMQKDCTTNMGRVKCFKCGQSGRIGANCQASSSKSASSSPSSGVPAAQLVGRRSWRRGQTAGGGSIPRWSTGKPQVVTRRKATGAGKKKSKFISVFEHWERFRCSQGQACSESWTRKRWSQRQDA